jgi:drug/metabolite transporter (DMT)-like permease
MPSTSVARNRILIAFGCVYFFWGSTYSAIRIAGEHIPPPLVGAVRTLLSTGILALYCIARGIPLRVSRATAWRLALVGILFMSLNNVLLVWAETLVPSGYASLVIAMIPIIVAVIETSLPGGETLNLRGWIGTFLGAVGMLVLVAPSLAPGENLLRHTGGPDLRRALGFVILTIAALSFAVGSILSRRFHFKVDTFAATAWQLGAASVVNFTVAALGGNFRTAVWTTRGTLAVVYLAVFGSVVGLTAYVYLLKHVPVTKVSTYAFVNPVVAVLIGIAFFSERLDRTEVAGMFLILVAVATVILSRTETVPSPSDPLVEVPVEE